MGLLLAITGCTSADVQPGAGVVIDLLQQDWDQVPGVAVEDGTLRVSATGRSIVEQDGGAGQSNPPVNLAGTHLLTDGDFTIRLSLSDVTADATVAFLASPPVIADEFRIQPAGVELTLSGDELRAAVFDDDPQQGVTGPEPVHEERATVSDPEAEIVLHRSGDRMDVISAGETVASVALNDAFDSEELWIGVSSERGSFTVNSLSVAAPSGTSLAAAGPVTDDVVAESGGLQQLASQTRPGFLVGAAGALGPLVSDLDYAQNFVANFGLVTPENAMKPQSLSPRQGEYEFAEADALLDIAAEHGIAVHGHTIAFTEAMPRWMRDLPADTEEQRAESGRILLEYVSTVVTHFAGRLQSLDVVNEPFDLEQGTSLQENIWYRVFGPEYPLVVSQAVFDADPAVQQFINENGADVPGARQDALRELARATNAAGGHIAGVGLQSHVYALDTDAISAEDLEATFARFGAAGLAVRISENDVTDGHGAEAQAEQYATVFDACLRSEVCISYTTWGVDDHYDWFIDAEGNVAQGHDLLFDDGEPTSAYSALIDVFDAD